MAESRKLAVLALHKIGEPPRDGWATWNYVPAETFAGWLELVRENGWALLDLHAFLAGLDAPDTLPEKAALVTFDDGYASMLEIAEPVLARYECPSVVFVPTDYVGGTNRFDHGNEPEERICDWDELRELERRGVAVQAHAVTHTAFSELSSEQQLDECVRARELLEERLDRPVETLAYPYGDAGSVAGQLAGSGYRAAFLYKGGPIRLPVTDAARFRLTRVALGPDSDLARELGIS